ncbi:Alkaline phosphatase 4 precursor [Phycisphaerae bacterium RAS1]|nr:Alkaline phosphatase 4 precursor [Phycisphaerae bacterium RAS1]
MKAGSNLSRRELVRLALAGGAAAGLPARLLADEPGGGAPAVRRATDRGAVPRNIVFMVADGMSLGVPSLAEPFSRLVRSRGTNWTELTLSPETTLGFFEMGSLNSLVTDSSAASSSWASGVRIFNNAVNMLPDGTKLTPIGPLARGAGRRVGLVTTTTITHATPAGFAAAQANRDDQHLIAPQYLDAVDVLMGGGVEYFDSKIRGDRRDLFAEFSARGYSCWTQRSEVSAEPLPAESLPDKVLGIFDKGHLPFTIDRNKNAELQQRVPTLAEMSAAALKILSRHAGGFLLQIEGGRVDHAAHNNDAAAIVWEQLAFDDAIGVALEFARRRDDTLVVITSDHGNSNPGLNGMGANYVESDRCFERLAAATASHDVMMKEFIKRVRKDGASPKEAVVSVLREGAGVEVTADEAAAVARALAGERPNVLNRQHANVEGAVGDILSNYNGVGWTGISHTADLVTTLAIGPGQAALAGLLRNTQAFEVMSRFMGISHRNPEMTREAARKFAAAPAAQRPHWV